MAKDRNSTDNGIALGTRIEAQARLLGFDLVGIQRIGPAARAEGSPGAGAYRAWLANGYHGEMGYLARPDAVAKRTDPGRILPGAQSIVVVALNYHTLPLAPHLRDDLSRGLLASYAWGSDYHDLMLPRLQQLAARVEQETGGPVAAKAFVDTGPILERAWAAQAGLGFLGRNTNLIHPRLGSWLFLGELLLTVDAVGQKPEIETEGTCGRCTRCLDACPTRALVAPYVLDARRCISYLTIELKGPIPRELRPLLGNRIFGCDICQEVCPWNRRFAHPTAQPAILPAAGARQAAGRPPADGTVAPQLLELLALDDGAFRRRFAGSPVRRAKRRGLLRSVAVALGNWRHPVAAPGLVRALDDAEPLVRGHAAWALGRIGTHEARQALQRANSAERDGWVRDEITAALQAEAPAGGSFPRQSL